MTQNTPPTSDTPDHVNEYIELLNGIHIGVLIQDADTTITACNDSALNLLGLTKDQAMGVTSFDPKWKVIHENGDDFPADTHPVAVAIKTRKVVDTIVMGVYRPSKDDRVWLLVTAKPLLQADGSVRQVICTFTDISDRVQATAELKAKNVELEAANALMVGRELKMVELKEENDKLKQG